MLEKGQSQSPGKKCNRIQISVPMCLFTRRSSVRRPCFFSPKLSWESRTYSRKMWRQLPCDFIHSLAAVQEASLHPTLKPSAVAALVSSGFLKWSDWFFTAVLSPTVGSASPHSLALLPHGPCRMFCHLKNRKKKEIVFDLCRFCDLQTRWWPVGDLVFVPFTSSTMPAIVTLLMRPFIWVVHVWTGWRVSDHRMALDPGSMLPMTWRLMVEISYNTHVTHDQVGQS